MKTISKTLMLAALATALAATPDAVFAQTARRSAATSRSSSSAATTTQQSSNTGVSSTSRSSAVTRSSSAASVPATQTQPQSSTTRRSTNAGTTRTTSSSVPATQTQPQSSTTRRSTSTGTTRTTSSPAPATQSQSTTTRRSSATTGSSTTTTSAPATQSQPTTARRSSAASSSRSTATATEAPAAQSQPTTARRTSAAGSASRSNANVTASKGLSPYQQNVPVITGRDGKQTQPKINNLESGAMRMSINDHNISRVHPRQRDMFMEFDRPGTFFSPDPHFFGYRITKLPPRPKTIIHWGRTYYYYNNVYYRPWGTYYVVSRPPFGVCIDIALREARMASIRFAYYHNVYRTFDIIDDNYRTINSQNKTIARNNAIIAEQNATMALNSNRAYSSYELACQLGLVQSYASASTEYFYEDGVFYTVNKKNQYEVIIPPAGALVSELPDDYEIITLNGIEYYQVDDTVYRLTLVDGTPYLEVLGQLTGALAQKYYIYK